jgi:SAM-dependent methyltransferase
MPLDAHQSKQEAKYHVPYHYLQTPWTVAGITYLSYLGRAREILLGRKPGRALDAGCGDGRFVAFVRERNPSCPIEGADYSETAIAFARLFNPGVPFHVADLLRTLPFHDASFDAVTLIEVVEHFELHRLNDVLRECRRILRPNGVVIITTPTVNEKKVSKAHFQHFTEASMRTYLKDAGFESATIEGQHRASVLQTLFHGLLENRLFAIRWKPLIALYRRWYEKRCNRCDVTVGKRMIVTAIAGASLSTVH